ncbi:MAG TPA: arginine--tRNA ligase [Polyangiales bacterium]
MRLERSLEELARRAIAEALGVAAPGMLRPATNAGHGDYQVNGVMPLAKEQRKPPRELAGPVAERLRAASMLESAEVAGPGFINLRLRPSWVAEQLHAMARDTEREGVPAADQPLRVVVDFSGPNIAKQMHVGHLRSTIIGEAVCRLLRFVGHDVIGDNHLGDWGTQFGLLIMGIRNYGSEQALDASPIDELERVYRLASAASKEDAVFAEGARAELAKLQRGDPDNRALWQRFISATRVELDKIYARLDIHFDHWLGESAYEEMLPGVVEDLKRRGLAREDQGAMCVFFDSPDDAPELSKSPFIVQKKDGAYLYATTDIATVVYRRDHFQAERALYFVDPRQSLHFKQLFALVKKLGVRMQLEHISFGSVLGKDGKPLKTRDGQVIRLSDLLDEAENRAAARMREEGLGLSDEQVQQLAPIVGIGAVKYADLMQNRLSDYQFDWDKMISFKGNAGPYLQYAHARIQAIFRKGEVDPATLIGSTTISLAHDAELALGKQLLRFADVVHQAAELSSPHLLCDHLYALARQFSVFYEACPVLRADDPAQRSGRLVLSWLVARQLRTGLRLLGIQVPERM